MVMVLTINCTPGYPQPVEFCDGLKNEANYRGREVALKTIVPGQEDWLFLTLADLNVPVLSVSAVDRLGSLVQALTEYDMQLFVALIPPRGLMQYQNLTPQLKQRFDATAMEKGYQKIRADIQAAGARVPDLLSLKDQMSDADFYMRRDHHWSPQGARQVAALVAAEIRQQPLYQSLPKQTYITERQGLVSQTESINHGLKAICGGSYPAQQEPAFKTYPAQQNPQQIVQEGTSPEVVLVGTSNSEADSGGDHYYNFDGFLKEYLQTDVLNHAIPGVGLDGSLMSYFLSQHYTDGNKPKFIIWELPLGALNLIDLSDEVFYQNLVAAIAGCDPFMPDRFQVKLKNVQLKPTVNISLLDNRGANAADLTDFKGTASLRLANPEFRNFAMIIHYASGVTHRIPIDRSYRIGSDLYYLPLDHGALSAANIESIELDADDNYDLASDIDFSLCR